jgi:hypothetical protein
LKIRLPVLSAKFKGFYCSRGKKFLDGRKKANMRAMAGSYRRNPIACSMPNISTRTPVPSTPSPAIPHANPMMNPDMVLPLPGTVSWAVAMQGASPGRKKPAQGKTEKGLSKHIQRLIEKAAEKMRKLHSA